MNREDVYALLPEHHWLSDAMLKEKCADVWLEAAVSSGWDKKGLENCPTVVKGLSRDCPYNNIDHTRGVTKLSVEMYETLNGCYPKAGDCDRDAIIAGALLHDVGKLFEYDYVDGQPVLSAEAAMFTHPTTGACLAKKHGLPDKVVHIILAHSDLLSPGGSQAFQTRESLIVKNADAMCFFYLLKHYGA